MAQSIERAAVIGAGVMGSALAAHIANAGIPVLLLDIVPPEGAGITGDSASRDYRDAFARGGLERTLKSKPAAFFTRSGARLVTVGNLEDDLARLSDADWVLEAVVERLDVKRDLFTRMAPHLKEDAIVTTNTSGLSVTEMAAALPEALRGRFLGTHFFNPPRYLHLLELVPHAGTDADVLARVRALGDVLLGKGVVVARDTPNFIANRVGGFAIMSCIRAMLDGGYTVEEVDSLTGPLIGRPKSASFRTADLVGVDIIAHASRTVYERATDDERRDVFQPPDVIERMLREKMLGDKSGRGFYQKIKKDGKSEILTLDLGTFDYRAREKPRFGSVEAARAQDGLGARVRAMLKAKDRAGEFVRRTLFELFAYAANRVGEVADDVVTIDRAMRWGFGWKLGPFELWDAAGVEETAARMREEGITLPAAVDEVLATPEKTFYTRDAAQKRFYLSRGERRAEEPPPGTIDLAALKAAGAIVKKGPGATLIDLGDGAACLEFHTKMNAIGADVIGMMQASVKEVEANFTALVVGNQGSNFSVGANLMLLLLEAQDGNWEEIDLMVRAFQKANMALKYSRRPVVAAPFGLTLGGGCEVVLGAGHAVAAAETYIGLVELGVGLIPAGGGCKELLLRNLEGRPNVEGVDLFPFARGAFETIGLAKVATSAAEARELKILRASDAIAMNPDRLLSSAKAMALGLAAQGYRRPDPTVEVPVAGDGGVAAIRAQLYNMKESGYISEYDAYLGGELGRILCGGEVPAGTMVREQYLLELEREVFLRLCAQRKSQDRMRHMLKTGKPLRN
ncbi:MAG: 3-hydroxyacyl-CoA dehydrogenase NAD-binding domain-containing protein [Candidatus Krumholzibacteria bacterium]|nr:3-hydroxyacyl-CoA dehydrogenase NAD-binding domain-containing protein [Candidatus Krumholzibacteria bacterium]